MSEGLTLGIDVGGTKIFAVVMDSKQSVISRAKKKTRRGGPEELAEQVFATATQALEGAGSQLDEVRCIGVGIPSSVDPETGDCHHSPNLGLKNYSLKTLLEDKFGQPVFLGNDVNCGTFAEFKAGAGKEFNSVVGYFVGTGLGGGIIVDGKLVTGLGGVAGELGHAIIKYGGKRCGCGMKGCIEAYCSKVAFVKGIKKKVFGQGRPCSLDSDVFTEKTRNLKSSVLCKAYRGGDVVIRDVLDAGFKKLGAAAASVVSVIAPECIVLGGGVVESLGEDILPVFNRSFKKHLFALKADRIQIRLSTLGDDAVAMGAGLLALEACGSK